MRMDPKGVGSGWKEYNWDWAECVNMGALSRDSGFNVFARVGWEWL